MQDEIGLGERIARWREHRDLTQAALANLIKRDDGKPISPSAVAQWEIDETVPTGRNQQKLIEALDLTPGQFWGRVPARKRKAS